MASTTTAHPQLQPTLDKAESLMNTSFEAIPVTKILAEFVAELKYETIPKKAVEWLKKLLLDYIGNVAFAATHIESSEPFLRAVRAFSGDATGHSTVITQGQTYPPQFASLLNAAFAHTLDWDDTHAIAALHPGASVISAALTEAEVSGAEGRQLITGLAAGYEVICRISRGMGRGAYERGFHNTGTTGIFGAIAAILSIRGGNAEKIERAFGLAGSKAAGSQQFLENGGWNKRLHPGFACHDARLVIAFVDEGVRTAAKPLEGIFGFMKGYSNKPRVDNMVEGLGKEWVFLTTAIKPYASCRITHGSIDLAAKWRKEKSVPIKKLHLTLAPHCYMIVGRPLENKFHPKNIVDAQFSGYYQLCLAWLDGNQTGWKIYDRIHDKDVNDLLDKITISGSEDMVGLASRLEMTWEDGTTAVATEAVPVGEPSNPFTDDQILQKFHSLADEVFGVKKSNQIIQVVDTLEELKNTKELLSELATP